MAKPVRKRGGGGMASVSRMEIRALAWSEPRERSKKNKGSLKKEQEVAVELRRIRSRVEGWWPSGPRHIGTLGVLRQRRSSWVNQDSNTMAQGEGRMESGDQVRE